MSTSVPFAPVHWEQVIDRHVQITLAAIAAKDFSIINAIIAQTVVAGTEDHAKTVFAITGSDDTTQQLQDINVNTAQTSEVAMKNYTGSINKLKESGNTNKADWEAELDAQEKKTVEDVTGKIHAATEAAKGVIRKLPEAARPAAANVWVAGAAWVTKAFDALVENMKRLLNSIGEFLKGIFESVQRAYEAVKGGVKVAIDAIKGFFSSAFSAAAGTIAKPRPVTNGTSLNGAHVPPPVIGFIGKLNWPAAASIATVTMGLFFVTEYLVDHKIRIIHQTMSKEANGKESVTQTLIDFDHKDGPTKAAKSPGNLAEIWAVAVDQLGKDGHFIPKA